MRFLFLIIAAFILNCGNSQIIYSGKIIDSLNNKPIEFVHIRIGNSGTTTNGIGEYKFKLPKDYEPKNVLLTCIGYQDKKISFEQFKNQSVWKISPKAYSLPEVFVFDNKMKIEEWGFNKKRYVDADGRNAPGFIKAVFISNSDKSIGIIQKVHYYISDKNNFTQPFRVRILEPDALGNPEKDLLNKSVIVQADKGGDFLTVDLTEYNITIPENGFFIGAEVLSTYNPDEFERYNHEKYYIAFGYTYKWHNKGMGWVYKPKVGWYHFKDRPERNSIGMSSVFYATVSIVK